MKTKKQTHDWDIKQGFSAQFPHDFRTFSAGFPLKGSGKGKANVQKMWVTWRKYLPVICKQFQNDPGVVSEGPENGIEGMRYTVVIVDPMSIPYY